MLEKIKAILFGLVADIAFISVVLLLGAFTRAEVLGADKEHMMFWLLLIFSGVSMVMEIVMDRKTIYFMWDVLASIIVAGIITLFFDFQITTFELTKVVPEIKEPFFGSIAVILFAVFVTESIVKKTTKKD